MTIVPVPKNVWTTIVTATQDTIVENLGHSEVFITTETPDLAGFKQQRLTITTIRPGETAMVYSTGKPTEVNYLEGGEGPQGPPGPEGPPGPKGEDGITPEVGDLNIDGGFF